jgi:PhnB protein
MLRSMMQVYAVGSDKAVELYKKAFDAELVAAYPAEDGTYYHSELNVYGQILSVAESRLGEGYPAENGVYPVSFAPGAARNPGNTMQFCLHFGEGNRDKIQLGYETLKEGGIVLFPLGPVDYSPLAFDVVDRFGVRWFLFE